MIGQGSQFDFYEFQSNQNQELLTFLSFDEISTDPQRFLSDDKLRIQIDGVEYNDKVARYILACALKNQENLDSLSELETEAYENGLEEKLFTSNNWNKYINKTPNSNSLYSLPNNFAKYTENLKPTSQHLHSAKESKEESQVHKSLRLSSIDLMALHLKPGVNTITYIVNTSLQSTQTITGSIFLWNYDTKIIISDIDGTLTKYFYEFYHY